MEKSRDGDNDEQPLGELQAELTAELSKPLDWRAAAEESKQHEKSNRIPASVSPLRSEHTAWPSRHGGYVRQGGPLIDQVTNSWRTEEKASAYYVSVTDEEQDLRCYGPGDEDTCPTGSRGLVRSRRFRGMIAVVLAIALFAWYGWRCYLPLRREWDDKLGFLPSSVNGTYGLARGGDFDGTAIKWLHHSLVPGGKSDPEGKRRLIFVGDIHGCKDELLHLLHKVSFNSETDHLIPTGDVISKGPDNAGVLDELIRLNAESVRGNHEDRILALAKTSSTPHLDSQTPATTSKGSSKDHKLLTHLKPHHMRYLRSMPLMLRIPALPYTSTSSPTWLSNSKHHDRITEDIIVVHAGLVPHLPLPKQDPYFVMNMRSIDHITHIPSALRQTKKGKSKPWSKVWNWYNDRLAHGRSLKNFHLYTSEEHEAEQAEVQESWVDRFWYFALGRRQPRHRQEKPEVVVYGHDSKAGLQLRRWSKGLDSGCVGGGKLTALVLDARGRTEVVQVGCRDWK
ncbi:hypothetical protein B0A50_06129 [Salinomyces thailandicus]|uniref:Calcineurin-like phosphoesterase domain-containing protein n=1 Tax=Salinomyces thailandicus TaxID=706561 RepID=A0A4U0TTA6_9PEZI|nr:hypothetical protein B0A50_06129 [Salinomyces thailandica]